MQIHELNKKILGEAIVGPGGLVRNLTTLAGVAAKPGGINAIGQRLVGNAPVIDPKTGKVTPDAYTQISRGIDNDQRVTEFKNQAWKSWNEYYTNTVKSGSNAQLNFPKFFNDWINSYIMATGMKINDLDPQQRASLDQTIKAETSRYNFKNPQAFKVNLDRIIDSAITAMTVTELQGKKSTRQNFATTPVAVGYSSPRADQAAQAMGINRNNLAKLAQYLAANNEKITVPSTGSASVDALLKAAGLM